MCFKGAILKIKIIRKKEGKMHQLKLLSTDFDGTLVGYTPEESCVDVLALELENMERSGALWSINTGRPLFYLLEGLEHFQAPIRPHYIMTNERHVYHYDDRQGWVAFGDWNQQCDLIHDELFKTCGRFFEQVEDLVLEYGGAVTILDDLEGAPEGLLAENEEMLDGITLRLMSLSHRPQDFLFQRTPICLRFCHRLYHKGAVLGELSRLLSIKSDHILAIGDHHNDLPMMHPQVAGMVACPANAHEAIKRAVHEAGGHVSLHHAGAGTAEGIALYRQGNKKPRGNN